MPRAGDGGATSAGAASAGAGRVGRFRWVLIGGVSLAMVVSFFDRSSIPILITDAAFLAFFGIAGDPGAQGLIATAYLLMYGVANVVLGPAIDWLGARRASLLMFTGGALASLASLAAPVFGLFLAARVVRGAIDAPQFPLMNRFVRNWFPPRERGMANATWLTALAVSSAIALPLFTWIVAAFGWQTAIVFVAASALVVAVPLLWLLTSDRPQQSRWASPAELAYIEAGNQPPPRATAGGTAGRGEGFGSGVGTFLRNPDFYLLNLFHISSLAIYWGLLTWAPKYLAEARGFSPAEMGAVIGLAFLAAAVATGLSGVVSDRLPSRAPLSSAMLLVCAAALLAAAFADSGLAAGIAIGVGLSARAVASPNLFAILQRMVPQHVIATGAGVDNGIANLGSALVPAAIGISIGVTGQYASGIVLLAGLAAMGAVAMGVLALRRY